ncbi:MAG: helix-turn-helix transcriptional regulator, partial [Merismopedia sp. SIO2A8]|nr:helix-turn-helix transcriptional regulator [Merismopedia sp. SIO2A8]
TFPNEDIVLDSEVEVDDTSFRIRVRWMDILIQGQACLLVTIEYLEETLSNQVTVDRWKYRLTPRESEVWELKRRGYSYQNIAATLYIAENTVKKHLKNIQAKRRDVDASSRDTRFN